MKKKGKQGGLVVHKPSPTLLNLEDVCQIWSMKIRHRFDERGKFMMSSHSKHCLVCESWGFTRRHGAGYYITTLIPFIGCWTCLLYGHTIGNLSRKENRVGYFEPLIAEFLNHWNEKHKSITEKP